MTTPSHPERVPAIAVDKESGAQRSEPTSRSYPDVASALTTPPLPAASPAEDATPTPEFQHRGWPPTRATSMAVSAFTGNTKLILNRVRNGERIELTQRGSPVAVLISAKDYATLRATPPSSPGTGAPTKSQVRHNAEQDPTYRPYCMRCTGLVRMQIVEPFYWRCGCGAEHDERATPGGVTATTESVQVHAQHEERTEKSASPNQPQEPEPKEESTMRDATTTETTTTEWPDPTPAMLDHDPLFDAIWNAIKKWDINVPHAYSGYMGATGNHARAIYDAVRAASPTVPA